MPSPVLIERYHTGGFIIREANGYRSRDEGLIVNGTADDLVLEAGTIMATLAADGSFAPYTGAGTTSAATAILYNETIIPANSSRSVTLITSECEVNAAELIWDPAVTTALKTSALTALSQRHIKAR